MTTGTATTAAAIDAFLAARKSRVSSTTLETDYTQLRRLSLETLGLPLCDLTPSHLWDALTAQAHLALNTRKRMRISLKAFGKWAHQEGLTATNLAADLPVPVAGVPPRAPRPFTWAELTQTLEKITPTYRPLVEFAAHTGLRMGELSALRSEDLVLSSKVPHVSVTKSKTKLHPLKATKSGRSRRVPLDRAARAIAAQQLAKAGPADLVFTGSRGGQIASPNFRRDSGWAAAAPGRHFHDLRHTAAVHWLGIPEVAEADIQRWLGHKDLSQTQLYLSGLAVTRRDQALLSALDKAVGHD